MVTPMDVAQRAELMATAAQTRISSHESECSRRYAEVAERFSDIDEKLDRMQEGSNKRFRAVVGGILTILGTVAAQIILKYLRII